MIRNPFWVRKGAVRRCAEPSLSLLLQRWLILANIVAMQNIGQAVGRCAVLVITWALTRLRVRQTMQTVALLFTIGTFYIAICSLLAIIDFDKTGEATCLPMCAQQVDNRFFCMHH